MLDWWSTKAARSNVVTRNYMQANMPGKYVYMGEFGIYTGLVCGKYLEGKGKAQVLLVYNNIWFIKNINKTIMSIFVKNLTLS